MLCKDGAYFSGTCKIHGVHEAGDFAKEEIIAVYPCNPSIT